MKTSVRTSHLLWVEGDPENEFFLPNHPSLWPCLKSCLLSPGSSTSRTHSSCRGVILQGWQKSSFRQVENDTGSIAHDWIYPTRSALFKGIKASHNKFYWLTQYSSSITSLLGYSYKSPLDNTMQLYLLDEACCICYLLYNKAPGPSFCTNFIGSSAWLDSVLLQLSKMNQC